MRDSGRAKRVGEAAMSAHRLFSQWFTGDVAYAVLPILILAFITQALGESFSHFGLISEWSFAAIVLLGVAVRRMIRLKVEVQDTPRSYKLDAGVQLLVLALIIAVVILAIVILYEKGKVPNIKTELLAQWQIAVFAIGLFSIFGIVAAEEEARRAESELPSTVTKHWVLRRLLRRVETCVETIGYINYAIDRASHVEFVAPGNPEWVRRSAERTKARILADLDELQARVSDARTRLLDLKVD